MGRVGTFPKFWQSEQASAAPAALIQTFLARQGLQVKEQLPVMRHVTGKRYGAAVAEHLINGAAWLPVFVGDYSNPPSGALSACYHNGPHMGAGHLDNRIHQACSG